MLINKRIKQSCQSVNNLLFFHNQIRINNGILRKFEHKNKGTIPDLEGVDSETRFADLDLNSTTGKLSKKRRKKSRTKGSVSRVTKNLSSAVEQEYLDTRTILEPGHVRHYKIQFHPKNIGHYEFTYEIEMTGVNIPYQINCLGDCDIPRIEMNPNCLYSACVPDKILENKFASNVFVRSTGVFDFGNILLCSGSIGNVNHSAKEAYVHLKNLSILPCEVTIDFLNKTNVFRSCREMIEISPSHIETLILHACPETLGKNTDVLALSIKHNPRVELIPLTCNGCVLTFEITPKKIIFERVLLHSPVLKYFQLNNKSLITIHWQFTNVDDFHDQFFITPIHGILKPLSAIDVVAEYLSHVCEVVTNKKLHLEVYREMADESPLLKDVIEMYAETCDLIVNYEKNIDFGEIKAKKEYVYNYVITNEGKYNPLFELTYINYKSTDPLNQNIAKMFTISQTSGVLSHQKPTTIILKFICNHLINIANFPIITCHLLDEVTRQMIGVFSISVSMKTNYSKFKIYPLPDINFGPLLVGTESTQKIFITNTGTLEFSYQIVCKRTLDLLQAKADKKSAANSKASVKTKSTKASKTSSKKSKKSQDSKVTKKSKESKTDSTKGSKKSKDKASKKSKASRKSAESKKGKGKKVAKLGPPISCGIFQVKNSKNMVQEGETAEIEVTCRPTTVGNLDETLAVFVSEAGPKDRLGKTVALKVIPCLPSLDFNDLESIFREHFIVSRLSHFEMPAGIGEHCVFIINTQTLQFNNVCLNTTASANLQLYNNGLIDAEVTISCSSQNNVFTVPVKTLYVLSYSHAIFSVQFSPTELEKYYGNLEIKIVMPVGFKVTEKLFALSGQGTVPEITLRIPKEQNNFNTSVVVLDPTLIGTYTSIPIRFENTGLYPCQVIVEVFDDPKYAFCLNIMTDSWKLLHCPEAHATDHFKKIKFSPGDIANFELVFTPKETDNFVCTVKIHIINNPFEVFTLNIEAICFTEDIILLNLPTSTTHEFITESISDLSLTNLHGINYQLNLGLIYVNTLYKQRFKIVNKSETFTYKFVFRSPFQSLKYIPSIGHLAPGTYKDIFVTFIAHAPLNIVQNLLDCIICKIDYTTPVENQNDISWDDRQKLLIMDESDNPSSVEKDLGDSGLLDKIYAIELNSEPEYEVVKDSIARILIFFSAVANYSKYECTVTDIELPETFIFEKQIFNFDVVNTGEINLEIKWNVVMENYSNLDLTFIKKPCDVPYKRIRDSKPRPLTGHEKFIGNNNLVQYVSQSKQASLCDTPRMPFKIEPTDFIIPPNTSKRMSLYFCPLEIYEYKATLHSTVLNLSPELNEITVNIKAQSLAASCHFDAQFSDYITSGRRLSKTCDTCEINNNTKVVEFDCLGVGSKHDFSFNIINPEEEDLQYSWRQLKSYELSSLPLFSCLHEKGVVMGKKQFPATFSLFPHKTGLFEALYNFKIEKYNIDIPFLLVACVREAKVNFTSSNVYLKPTVLGIAVHDTVVLKNHEDVKIHFKIKKNSLYSEGRRQFVTVEPKEGCLKKKSETKIKINFNPTDIGDESFILKCKVDFSQRPINLAITTKCHAVEVLVSCLIAGKRIVLTEDNDNVLNLGEILPQHKEEIIFYVRNQGKIGFYYFWKYNDEFVDNKFDIKLNTLEGYVKMNSELAMILNITALRNATLKNFRLELQVRYGPMYKILLNTAVAVTTYKFSFLEFDFGPCFVQNSSICYYHKALEVYNQGTSPIILELTFFNQEHLTVDFKMKTIPPKRKELISICFHPKKIQKYKNELIFTVNDKDTKVVISGEGIVLNIGLVNIEEKSIDLGSPAVGKTVVKVIKVINKSLATVNAIFDVWNRLPIVLEPLPPNTHYLKPHKKEKIIEDPVEIATTEKKKGAKKAAIKKSDKSSSKKSKSTKKSDSTKKSAKDKNKVKSTKSKGSTKKKSRASRKSERKSTISIKTEIDTNEDDWPETKMISITPTKAVTIFPNKISEFTITYSPSQKIQPFTNKVSVQVLEMVQPLCIIKGACLGPSFFLDREDILFGVVVQYCSRSVKVMLHNEGDINSRFHWECENKEDFSFTPVQGYSAAGTPTMIVMHYHPTHLNLQTKNIAYLILEAVKIPLSVNLTGLCANIPDPIATIRFECCVRTSTTETVTIVNNSMQRWKLYPQLNSDNFTCTNMINISEKGSSVCEIVYSPLNMTKKEPHKATLFIKIPDGHALVYELEGKATRPEALKSLYLEVHCKTLHKEVFPVHNWSRSKQTFKVFTEDITINSEDILYEISGQETLEVMGNNTRNYEWYFYPYKEGGVEVRVIFMNDEKEYIFYQVLIKVIKCKTLETIELSSCVRSSKIHKLLLINPLDNVITYKLTSNSPLISFSNNVIVPPNSELYENIEFLPILCEETSTTLEASCVELGPYIYEFKLKGLPPIAEPPILIKIPLGKQKIVNVMLKNFTKLRAVFNTKIEHESAFIVSKAISLNLYQSGNFPVTFFPHEIGEIKTALLCQSSTAGDYEFPIIATCTAPKPKGPLRLKVNSSIFIEFTNPFLTEKVFNFFIEPQAFVLINNEETIKARSTIKILVKLLGVEKHCKVIGRLVVSPENDEKIKWTFYLEQE